MALADLDNIGTTPPSADFLEYYRDNLETAMRRDGNVFRNVLDQNLPPREFLMPTTPSLTVSSPITASWASRERLARLAQGQQSRRLIGQRFPDRFGQWRRYLARRAGIYVLEKLLGYTPPPPPPDVPAIEPDIRGTVTIREQLIKHREIATCAECHRKIDPLGFALENFDAIGGWRRTSDKDPIDSTGKLPGDTFKTRNSANAGERQD